ncbi:MAG: tetraacyldisaccharide 4'-kinase [Bacteriovoracaceae bacterium]
MKFILKKLKNKLFAPISFLWELIYRVRRLAYNTGVLSSKRFAYPVISVGNISFGGTGKTPLIMWLSEFINKREQSSIILTRGYKSQKEKSYAILSHFQKKRASAKDIGDEAMMILERLQKGSVIVGRKRVDNLIYAADKVDGDVVLLDDGHQHLKIERDMNIVLFDALMPLSRYHTPPLGYLREGLTAIKDSNFILIGRTDQTTREKVEGLKQLILKHAPRKVPIAEFCYVPDGVYDKDNKKLGEGDFLKGKRVCAVTAIASPKSFYNMIDHLGGVIVKKFAFADHYFYTEDDLDKIQEFQKKEDILVVTTEKDFVKLSSIKHPLNFAYCKIDINFTSGEEEFKNELRRVCDGLA